MTQISHLVFVKESDFFLNVPEPALGYYSAMFAISLCKYSLRAGHTDSLNILFERICMM